MPEKWDCPKCGRKNEPAQPRCVVCRTRNPRKLRSGLDRDRHRARLRGWRQGLGR